MWLVIVARPTPWWKPWSMMTRLPQAVWKYSLDHRAVGRGADRGAAGGAEVDAVVQRAVAVDRVGAPAERRGDRPADRVVEEAVGADRAAVAEDGAGLAGARAAAAAPARASSARCFRTAAIRSRSCLQAAQLREVGLAWPCRPPLGPRRGASTRSWRPAASAASACASRPCLVPQVGGGRLALGRRPRPWPPRPRASCTVSSAREASSRSRTTDSLSMTFCTEFSWPVSSAGSWTVSTIDRPISDGSPGLVVLHDDLAERRPARSAIFARPAARSARACCSRAHRPRRAWPASAASSDLGGGELAAGLGEVGLGGVSWACAAAARRPRGAAGRWTRRGRRGRP